MATAIILGIFRDSEHQTQLSLILEAFAVAILLQHSLSRLQLQDDHDHDDDDEIPPPYELLYEGVVLPSYDSVTGSGSVDGSDSLAEGSEDVEVDAAEVI